eukprot:s8536_g2.t1
MPLRPETAPRMFPRGWRGDLYSIRPGGGIAAFFQWYVLTLAGLVLLLVPWPCSHGLGLCWQRRTFLRAGVVLMS